MLGAAGGIGLTAIEIGKRMGATVIACARGADKLAVAAKAGADHLINSETDDLRAVVKSLGGADVVYDPVGGDQFKAALRACNPEGADPAGRVCQWRGAANSGQHSAG